MRKLSNLVMCLYTRLFIKLNFIGVVVLEDILCCPERKKRKRINVILNLHLVLGLEFSSLEVL